jgi:hypothetical protein
VVSTSATPFPGIREAKAESKTPLAIYLPVVLRSKDSPKVLAETGCECLDRTTGAAFVRLAIARAAY